MSHHALRPAWRNNLRTPFVPPPDARVIYDSFTGSGALGSHTPDICPVGSSWSVKAGSFANLSGGILPYANGTSHNANAIINAGIAAYDIRCRCYTDHATYGSTGIILCSNADGTNQYKLGLSRAATVTMRAYKYTNLTTSTTQTTYNGDVPSDAYHTIRAIMQASGELRYGLDDRIYATATLTDYITNTYVGVGHYYADANNAWDWFDVRPLPTFRNITFIGDSISDPTAPQQPVWSKLTMWNYSTGYFNYQNHAVSGQEIVDHMAAQVAAAATDTPDKIFVALGTNDADEAAVQTVYAAQLQQLWSDHPGVPIYCLNILPRTLAPDNGTANNTRIAAAVATAQGAGVNVTLWDTRNPAAWINPATDTAEGLHPNEQGAWKIALEALSRLD